MFPLKSTVVTVERQMSTLTRIGKVQQSTDRGKRSRVLDRFSIGFTLSYYTSETS